MKTKSIVGFFLTALVIACVGCGAANDNSKETADIEGRDMKPVIYLYPEEDGTEVSVRLDYDGNLVDIIPEFNQESTWNVTADANGQITFEGQAFEYLFWEGDPDYSYDFFSGFCIRGSDTESFLNKKLPELGLNESETAEFIEFWLPMMEDNAYNLISFQGAAYNKGAMLTVTPEPDTLIRVFMAWYPTDRYIKINPQYIQTPERYGFTVVEWGGNKIK